MSDLPEPPRYKREDAGVWRPEIPPEDTAPPPADPGPSLADWGATAEEARSMLKRQFCPVCGEGPWKSPLTHAAKKHGIDRFTMRDLCGLTLKDSVAAPELSQRQAERGRANDMTAIGTRGAGTRRAYRHTSEGIARLTANLASWEADNPDAANAQRSEAGKAGAAARWRP